MPSPNGLLLRCPGNWQGGARNEERARGQCLLPAFSAQEAASMDIPLRELGSILNGIFRKMRHEKLL